MHLGTIKSVVYDFGTANSNTGTINTYVVHGLVGENILMCGFNLVLHTSKHASKI